ncbi:MAG: hypothetical protein Pars2KO_01160 [Parasphingorhabdus sp.]
MDPERIFILTEVFPIVAVLGVLAVGGWIYTTRLKIKNGYPLEGMWGQSVYPKSDQEAVERVKLLTQENAELRAEIGSMKDRLANVERIVTDDSHRLTQEIEALQDKRTN